MHVPTLGCTFYFFFFFNPPRWLSGERVGLMTWWLLVRSPVEANFLSGVFSPLKACEHVKHVRKVVGGFGEKFALVLV